MLQYTLDHERTPLPYFIPISIIPTMYVLVPQIMHAPYSSKDKNVLKEEKSA